MKADKMRISLECLRGSVSTELDAIELFGQIARTCDGGQWAQAVLPEPIPTPMTLHYSTLRSIVKTLDEKEEMEIKANGVKCLIKTPTASWELTFLNIPQNPPPEFEAKAIIEISGYELFRAYRSLKHLVNLDLSEPGLMWGWTNENQELVIGSGAVFGGHPIGSKDLEIPLMALNEVGRILAIQQSEKAIFKMGENYLSVKMGDRLFQVALPNGPRFKPDWVIRAQNMLTEDPQELRISRSELMRAVSQVEVTAAESMVRLASCDNNLILTSVDEHGNQSKSTIEADGNLKEPINLNIKHLKPALEALSDELIILTICKSAVKVSDKNHWEIMTKR